MALVLSSAPNDTAAFSQGTGLSPFAITFDGRYGGAIDKRVYVRNDSPGRWYSDILIRLIDNGTENWVNDSKSGYKWQLSAKDIAPTFEEWGLIVPGASLALPNIGNAVFGNTSIYIGFWIRVTIPNNQLILTRKSVLIHIQSTEHLI